MKKLILSFFLLFLLISCRTKKIQNSQLFQYEELNVKGKVKTITCYSFLEEKNKNNNDSIKYIIVHNGKKNPERHLSFYSSDTITTYYIYDKNNLLIEKFSNNKDRSSMKKEYDDNGNVINFKSLYKGVINVEKKIFYDKNNNKIKEIHLNRDKPGDTTLCKYDYNKRIMTTYLLKSKREIKMSYNKKGEIIQSFSRYGKLLYEYDKMGRVSKRIKYDINDNLIFEEDYINVYDKKKNLIETKVILDKKLFKTDIYQIEYY